MSLSLCFLLFQLTAFGGDLKYTVSYDIPVESVDSDIVSSVDVIIQVDFFQIVVIQTLLGNYDGIKKRKIKYFHSGNSLTFIFRVTGRH